MRKSFFALFLLSLSLFGVENYTVFLKQYHDNEGTLLLTLRQFTHHAQRYYLILNPQTLQTTIAQLDAQSLRPLDNNAKTSLFGKLLYQSTQLTDFGGIREATQHSTNNIFLTMDMCPSSKHGYEKEFLTQLTNRIGKIPIGIAITSVWIKTHEKEFNELSHNPLLNITWINHTHTHFYDPRLPNSQNFMRHVGTNLNEEILGLERTLIEKGEIPSVFFRFPGLIADQSLMRALREQYFLIPISSQAWVAKNEPIKKGSIILVHGNKNEHQGIVLLEKKFPYLLQKYHLKTLTEAFVP
ncbi:MAG: hypothetical protein PHR87_01725 [Sulfurospirillaceae bacterium]|nr:hypothetical protein [Sulfurospirillaceae bacterium]